MAQLQRHKARLLIEEDSYAAAVAEVAESLKGSQLEDHPGEQAAGTHSAMLDGMSSWTEDDVTAARLREAHAKLLPGGGKVRTVGSHVGSTRFVEPVGQLEARLHDLAAAIR